MVTSKYGDHPNYHHVKQWIPKMLWAAMERQGYELEHYGYKSLVKGKYKRIERFEEAKLLFQKNLDAFHSSRSRKGTSP